MRPATSFGPVHPTNDKCCPPARPVLAPHAFLHRTRGRVILSLLLVAALVGGCMNPVRQVSGGEVGTMHLVMPLSTLQGGGFSGAKLRLTQGLLVRELLLDVTGELISAEIDRLPVGDWVAELDIYDVEGDVTHTATGVARVRPGETAILRLEAQPHDGILEITAHIHEFSEAALVQKVRITFQNGQYATLQRDENDPLVFYGTKELRPGDHDYRIELYGEQLLASHRYYQSPWESVRIHAGKTVRATWHAASGAVHVEMGMTRMPAPPALLTVTESSEHGYLLSWDASPDADVTMYRVYLKKDEFAAYSARHETPASERTWAIPDKELAGDTWAAVTAVTADGRESFRSNVVFLPKRAS